MFDRSAIGPDFRAAAADAQLDVELAVTLALERKLALVDAETVGLADGFARPYLNRHAAEAKVTRELTGPLSSYLRVLTGRAFAPPPPDRISLPVRIYPRVLSLKLAEALAPQTLAEALAWERAAVLSGRLMSEWALIHVCQLSRSAVSSIADAGGNARQLA
jgi:hypothetical protein